MRNLGEIERTFAYEIESGDGRYYARLNGSNGIVSVFRSGSGKKVAEADRRANFKGAAFRPGDRSLLLAGSDGIELGIWYFAASEAFAHVPVAGQPTWIGFSSDGARLLARDEVGEAAWRLPGAGTWAAPVAEESTLDPDAPPIRPPFPLPTAAAGTDGEGVLAEATLPDGLGAVLVGGKFLRGGQSRRLEIWKDGAKRAEREVRPVLDEDRAGLLILAENGAFVFTGASDGLNMFDTATLQSVTEIFHAGAVHAGARADGAFTVTVDGRNDARIWDLTQNLEVTRFTLAHAPLALELSPDGRWLAVLGPDRNIELWALDPADLIAQACLWLEAPCP
jgi:WD40 repeat protein